jgi:hypothetical protein
VTLDDFGSHLHQTSETLAVILAVAVGKPILADGLDFPSPLQPRRQRVFFHRLIPQWEIPCISNRYFNTPKLVQIQLLSPSAASLPGM